MIYISTADSSNLSTNSEEFFSDESSSDEESENNGETLESLLHTEQGSQSEVRIFNIVKSHPSVNLIIPIIKL